MTVAAKVPDLVRQAIEAEAEVKKGESKYLNQWRHSTSRAAQDEALTARNRVAAIGAALGDAVTQQRNCKTPPREEAMRLTRVRQQLERQRAASTDKRQQADIDRSLQQLQHGGWRERGGMANGLYEALRAEGLSDNETWWCRPARIVNAEIEARERALSEADAALQSALAAWTAVRETDSS